MTSIFLLLLLFLLEGSKANSCEIECATVANSCFVCFQTCQQNQ